MTYKIEFGKDDWVFEEEVDELLWKEVENDL